MSATRRQAVAALVATVVAMRVLTISALGERGPANIPVAMTAPYIGGAWQIAFSGLCDDQHNICVVNTDGSNATNLTNDHGDDYDPAWSPDGRKIAFYSSRSGYWEIYVMNANGSNREQLTHDGGWSPSWSPDGTQIAFVSDRASTEDIYVMSADGSRQRRLTYDRFGDIGWKDWGLSWSPDGKKIAFSCYRDGDWEIYRISTNGTGLTKLTDNNAHDGFPAWSPDNKKIAFVSTRNQRYEIYVMSADGSNQTRIIKGSSPAWSPDGTKIAFQSHPLTHLVGDIYVANIDGTGQVIITRSGNDRHPSWRPPYRARLPLVFR